MKFPLNDIEFFIADQLIEAAEVLIEGQKIQQLQEIERNLWIALVDDTDTYEVEVQITPSKVDAFTCECQAFKEKNLCKHVTAILLLLRKKIRVRKEKAAQKKAPKEKLSKRITTASILDLVKPNELKAFVKIYAIQDRTFSLMLKAHFAHIIPNYDESDRIRKVLENTINSVRRPGKSINTSGIKLIQKVTTTILQQSEAALSRKHYADVFENINAIIVQLAPLINSNKDDLILPQLLQQAYQILLQLGKKNIAPQLENEIWTFLINESTKPTYYINELWENLLDACLFLANTQSRQDEFSVILDGLLAERFATKNTAIRSAILSTKLGLLNNQDNQAGIEFFLKHNMNEPDVVISAIQINIKKGEWEKVQRLASHALTNPDLKDLSPFYEFLLTSAIELHQKKHIRKYARHLFIYTYDFKYFDLIKSNTGKKWNKVRTEILNELIAQPFSIENRNCIARIYAEEKMGEVLLNYIRETKS